MDAIQLINTIRKDLEDVRQQGRKTIRISALQKYLTELQDECSIASTSDNCTHYATLVHQSNLAGYVAQTEDEREHYKAVIQSGQAALRSAILINGGAAVALLAFIGNLMRTDGAQLPETALRHSLLTFIWGVLAAAVATGFTYLAVCFACPETRRRFATFNGLAIACVVLSYLSFIAGGFLAWIGFGPASPN